MDFSYHFIQNASSRVVLHLTGWVLEFGPALWYRLHDLHLSISQVLKTIANAVSFLLQYIERLVRPVCHIIGFLQSVPWLRQWKSDLSVEKRLLFLCVLLSGLWPETLRFRIPCFLETCYQMLISIDDHCLNYLLAFESTWFLIFLFYLSLIVGVL